MLLIFEKSSFHRFGLQIKVKNPSDLHK